MSIHDSLVMTLRLIIPQMVNPKFINAGNHDVVVFWVWFALYQQQIINSKFAVGDFLYPQSFIDNIFPMFVIHCY